MIAMLRYGYLSKIQIPTSTLTTSHTPPYIYCFVPSNPFTHTNYPRRGRSIVTTRMASSANVASLEIPSLKLNDGISIPLIGYGTGTAWFKPSDASGIDRNTVEAVKTAIKVGYHHLDTAEIYNTEPEVGIAIKESGIARDKLFVTTKVMNNTNDISGAIDGSLKKLQLDFVDLYLIHSPFFARSDVDFQKAWTDMEAVKKSGRARSIGVSNYLQTHLEATLKTAKIPPSINQTEYHPYLQHGNLLPYQARENIATAAYGPLVPETKAKPGPCDSLLENLAKKYNVMVGQVLLRWCIDQGVVVVTTSSKEDRLREYLGVFEFKLTPKEVKDIAAAGEEKHFRAYWQKKFADDDRS